MRLQNSGHNCIAGQVVIAQLRLAAARRRSCAELRRAFGARPGAPGLVPAQRRETRGRGIQLSGCDPRAVTAPALLVEIGAGDDATALETTEYFAPVLGRRRHPGQRPGVPRRGRRARERQARRHARRERPDRSRHRRRRSATASRTRSPTCATARSRSTPGRRSPSSPRRSRGAATPAATLENVVSGIGVVHNALLLDGVERSRHARAVPAVPAIDPADRPHPEPGEGLGAAQAAVVRRLPHRRDRERGLHPLPHGRQPRRAWPARSCRRSAHEPAGARPDRRLHRRRRGIGRRRPGRAAERGPVGLGAAARGGRARQGARAARARRVLEALPRRVRLELRHRARSRRSRTARSSGRAARRSAARRR